MRCFYLSLAMVTVALVGCGEKESPDAQVRQTIAAIEEAAEARDVGELMEHISDEFRDGYGRDGKELTQYVRGYFIANQSINLLTRIRNIEFPTQDEARAQMTVAMVASDGADSSVADMAAELHDFDVTFMREDGDWKVTHAKWGDRAR